MCLQLHSVAEPRHRKRSAGKEGSKAGLTSRMEDSSSREEHCRTLLYSQAQDFAERNAAPLNI
jgi:hypothetical protein